MPVCGCLSLYHSLFFSTVSESIVTSSCLMHVLIPTWWQRDAQGTNPNTDVFTLVLH